jgi:hypothetical protein
MAVSIQFRTRAATPRHVSTCSILITLVLLLFCVVHAAELPLRDVPGALAVRNKLPPPEAGIIDLKFHDLFKMPVGPRGLEPSDALLAASGKEVRLIGFMVREEAGAQDGFLLTSLPVAASDEDEGLADDLPPALIRVAFVAPKGQLIPYMPGLLQVSGTLRLQSHVDSSSQRISAIQLEPDRPTRRALSRAIARSRVPHH